MLRSSSARWALGVVAVLAVLALLRFKPWQRSHTDQNLADAGAAREQLTVGFLPVT